MPAKLATGEVEVVNAGHVLPLLVRDGIPAEVVFPADAAFGIAPRGDVEDDATVPVLDCYGGPTRARDARPGATEDRAST